MNIEFGNLPAMTRVPLPEPQATSAALVTLQLLNQAGGERDLLDEDVAVHRLPQHVLGGVAQPKVGTEGERGEEFSHSDA